MTKFEIFRRDASVEAHVTSGVIADEYLISVSVDRMRWSRIDFSALDRIDLVAALTQFELRRRMTKTGIFIAVEPFAAPSAA